MCMDYSNFAYQNYGKLVRNFKPIPQVLTKQLFLMEQLGFDPDRAYLFGFSLGAHIVARGGEMYGSQKIRNIDSKYEKWEFEYCGLYNNRLFSNSLRHCGSDVQEERLQSRCQECSVHSYQQ